jgi:hypothetical protein
VPEIITRAEAKTRGLKRYFTGKPCKRGHVVERRVSSSGCPECTRIWREQNPDRVMDSRRVYNARN